MRRVRKRDISAPGLSGPNGTLGQSSKHPGLNKGAPWIRALLGVRGALVPLGVRLGVVEGAMSIRGAAVFSDLTMRLYLHDIKILGSYSTTLNLQNYHTNLALNLQLYQSTLRATG